MTAPQQIDNESPADSTLTPVQLTEAAHRNHEELWLNYQSKAQANCGI